MFPEPNNNQISSLAYVHHNVVMGKNNVIMEGAIIREGVVMGDNNYIGPYCILGDVPEKKGCFDDDWAWGIRIGHNNRFTKQVTIDKGTEQLTYIGDNVLMLKNSHIGHDCTIHDDVVLSCNSVIGGFTEVGKGTNFGIGAVAHQRLVIPEGCMIGMNSTVTKKSVLRAGFKYVGSPVRELGPNIRFSFY